MTPGSSFTLPDSEFFLDGALTLDCLHLKVQWLEHADSFAIMVLMNLCTAGKGVSFPAFVGTNLMTIFVL
jgi:hypothetical protein